MMKFNINLIIYDFDGVMTNNKVYVDQNGNEMVQVNRADGLGVSEIAKLGIKQIIISTEKNSVVNMRAKKLGIDCFQGIDNKIEMVKSESKKMLIDLDKIAYVGNDINDLYAMQICGVKFCPSDAHQKIIQISDVVLKSKGGDGIVREILDLLTN